MGKMVIDFSQLEALEQSLEFALTQTELFSVPLQVRCCLSEEKLIITVSTTVAESFDPQKFLKCFRQTLKDQTSFQDYPIQIYWSDEGMSYYFKDMASLLTANFKKTSSLEKKLWQFLKIQPQRFFDEVKFKKRLLSNLSDTTRNTKTFNPKDLNYFFLATGVGLGIIFGGIYPLTRPCVLGKCQIIKDTEQQVNTTFTVLKQSPSEATMLKIKQELEQSINLLQSIPWWSSYYSDAQIQKKAYTQELNNLSIIIASSMIQNQVVSPAKSISISLSQWQKSQENLSQAISDLETIPKMSNFYDLAQEKIKIYHDLINHLMQKISVEEKAEISFNLAQKASEIAKDLENSARNLSDLNLLISTWRTVVKRLQEIPPGTVYYKSSRALLKTYSTNMSQAEKRQKQEELGVKLFEQGQEQAKLAENAQSRNQWSQSVSHWNEAIHYLQGIPTNTFQSTKSQPLIATYTLALNKAKSQLKLAIILDKVHRDLEGICTNTNQVCDYKIDGRIIKIKLTSDYIEQLWNTALQAKVQGNLQIQTELLHHLSSFEYRLQTISDRTGQSIEVYNAQGNLMAVYQKRQ